MNLIQLVNLIQLDVIKSMPGLLLTMKSTNKALKERVTKTAMTDTKTSSPKELAVINNNYGDDPDDGDPHERLVREALDPDKPSKLDALGAALNSLDTPDEVVERLLRLLLVDGGLPTAMKTDNKKRIISMLVKVKFAPRGTKSYFGIEGIIMMWKCAVCFAHQISRRR